MCRDSIGGGTGEGRRGSEGDGGGDEGRRERERGIDGERESLFEAHRLYCCR